MATDQTRRLSQGDTAVFALAKVQELAAAFADIQAKPGTPPQEALCDPGLWPSLEAVDALVKFLSAFPDLFGPVDGSGPSRPLFDLFLALNELISGHTHPILRTENTGRRASSIHYQAVTAWGAIALDAHIRNGMNHNKAACLVASELRDVQVSGGSSRNAVKPATVKGWRNEINAGNAPQWAMKAWTSYTKQRTSITNTDALADWAMGMLRELVQQSGFRISP